VTFGAAKLQSAPGADNPHYVPASPRIRLTSDDHSVNEGCNYTLLYPKAEDQSTDAQSAVIRVLETVVGGLQMFAVFHDISL